MHLFWQMVCYHQNVVSAQYLMNESVQLDQCCIYIYLNHTYFGIVTHLFLQVYNRVMANDYLPEFVST